MTRAPPQSSRSAVSNEQCRAAVSGTDRDLMFRERFLCGDGDRRDGSRNNCRAVVTPVRRKAATELSPERRHGAGHGPPAETSSTEWAIVIDAGRIGGTGHWSFCGFREYTAGLTNDSMDICVPRRGVTDPLNVTARVAVVGVPHISRRLVRGRNADPRLCPNRPEQIPTETERGVSFCPICHCAHVVIPRGSAWSRDVQVHRRRRSSREAPARCSCCRRSAPAESRPTHDRNSPPGLHSARSRFQ